MKLIDMHCDTLWKLIDSKGKMNLQNNQTQVNIEAMKKAGSLAQFFACFTCAEDFKNCGGYDAGYEKVLKMIELMKRQEELFCEEISMAYSKSDIWQARKDGKIAAFLTIEEGGIINGKIERLQELYEKGIRLVTIMWNYENCMGHPNSKDKQIMESGLKKFGTEAVECMGELGMVVDVSHASDGTFWDVLQNAKGPVIASHSNCRTLCEHPRNLSDDMIRALAEKGGVSGLNFYGVFLGNRKESLIEEMTAHVLHMIKVGGSEFPAIGTDFDGFDGMEKMEIANISQVEKLWNALKKKGLSENQLDKIWYKNIIRLL